MTFVITQTIVLNFFNVMADFDCFFVTFVQRLKRLCVLQIQLIASDTDAHVVNSWSPEQQSLLNVSKPSCHCSLLSGVEGRPDIETPRAEVINRPSA